MTETQDRILTGAMTVFGRYGLKKTTMDDIAEAAGVSKQCLYLHYAGKNEIYVAALVNYLQTRLDSVRESLDHRHDLKIGKRLTLALENWFGRHMDTFSLEASDLRSTGNELAKIETNKFKKELIGLLAASVQEAFPNRIGAKRGGDIAATLFVCGLSWSEPGLSRADFSKRLKMCVAVCLPEEKME